MCGKSTTFIFDIFGNDSPLINGLDVGRYYTVNNLSTPSPVTIKRPSDSSQLMLRTYIASDDPINVLLRVLVTEAPYSIRALSVSIGKHSLLTSLANRLHLLTHAHPNELVGLCDRAGWLTDEVRVAI